MSIVSAPEHEFDVVVWGATGFAGRLTAQHLLERYNTSLRWALAGATGRISFYWIRSARTDSTTCVVAMSISSAVVNRPSENRMLPRILASWQPRAPST